MKLCWNYSVRDNRYWRYVFRLGNLLNIVEKVTGIDYSCYDIPRTPKVWTSWLEINYNSFKLETWNGNAFKLETSQSPKYSERKYCLLPFSFGGVCSSCANWWWWWLWWWWWINLRVCGENSRCPWKTARSKALLVVKTELSLLRSAWPPAESTVTLKITHAEAWNFFCAVFHLTISDYSSHQHWCSRWKLIRGKTVFSPEKERTKDCFLLT